MTKRTNQIFLATSIALLTFITVSGQGGSKSTSGNTAKTTAAPVQATPSEREQDGYNGPVMRMKSEVAKLINKNGRIIEGAKAVFETIEYDMKGTKKFYNINPSAISAGEVTGKETYKYDEKGNISEMTLLNADGSIAKKEIYAYEYDFMDNWKKMTTSVAVFEDGKIKYEPTEVTQRTISYFMNAELMKKYEAFEAQKNAATNNTVLPTPSNLTPNLQPTNTNTSGTQTTTTQQPKVDNAKADANHPNTTTNSSSTNSSSTNPSSTNVASNKVTTPSTNSSNNKVTTPSTSNNAQTEIKPAQPANSNKLSTSNNTTSQTETKTVQPVNNKTDNTNSQTQPKNDSTSTSQTQPKGDSTASSQTQPKNDSTTSTQTSPKNDSTSDKQTETANTSEQPVVSKPVKTFGRPISGGVLNGKALSLPPPDYPDFAKRARISGLVKVEVVIDETGKVISAKAIDGPGMLQSAAQQAAMRAKFSPTKLSEQAVKVTGVINYNFALGN